MKLAGVAQNVFACVMNRVTEASRPESVLKAYEEKLGERAVSAQEVIHQILGSRLYCAIFQYVIIYLDNNKHFLY